MAPLKISYEVISQVTYTDYTRKSVIATIEYNLYTNHPSPTWGRRVISQAPDKIQAHILYILSVWYPKGYLKRNVYFLTRLVYQ